MTEIVKHQPTNLPAHYQPQVLAAQMDYARALAESNLLPKQYFKQPANLLWAISYGQTLGVDPMTAVQSIHVINGKPTASADLIAGLVRRAGHKLRIAGDDRKATAQIIRADDPEFVFEAVWTIERANAAKLTGKDTWKAFPAAMLKARAITEVARAACSEILQGTIYTPEEMGAVVDQDGNPVDAPVEPLRRVPSRPSDERQDYMVQVGNVAVRRDAFQPHPEGQEFAKRAAQAMDRAAVTAIVGEAKEAELINSGIEAPDSGEPDMLRSYLQRRWKALPERVPAAPAGDDGVQDVETVDEPPADDHATAVAELHQFATEQQIADIDDAAYGALGVSLAEASAASIRSLLAQLRGTAA
jgi:hypothetical protein